jgi:hemerythrin-like domain-containing protein
VNLLDELAEEHRLIDDVAGSLLAWSREGGVDPAELDRYLGFFRRFVRAYHHEREERVLFLALMEEGEVPGDRGPIPVLVDEHRELDRLLTEVETAGSRGAREQSVTSLVHHLWEHLDKERSVLLPEARKRLRRSGIRALEGRAPDAAEAAARRDGEALVAARPPVDDPDIVRGDGCICCGAFASACHGIEAEWWTAHEWRHHRALDEG